MGTTKFTLPLYSSTVSKSESAYDPGGVPGATDGGVEPARAGSLTHHQMRAEYQNDNPSRDARDEFE
jgi:hypothetical protein